MAAAATERRLARKRRCAALRKRATSQISMLKALTMRLPGDGLVQNVLHVGELVLSGARGGAHAAADAHGRENDDRDEQQPAPRRACRRERRRQPR